MNLHEPAWAGLYDHEQDAVSSGRRQAPDWGGDDLFTSMPGRRRFDRPAPGGVQRADHGSARAAVGADHDGASGASGTDHDSIEHLDWTPRQHGERFRRRDTMEHPVQRRQRPPVDDALRRRSPLELPDVTERTAPLPETASAPVVEGRRTVTITGHPDRVPVRRRPAPTLDERLVGRNPERIAMYAFALGLLLIVIAFLSANA